MSVLARVLSTWVANEVDRARALARLHPHSDVIVEPVLGGALVLNGPGQYVNRVLGAAMHDLEPADVDVAIKRVEAAAAAVGVAPSWEISELTEPSLATALQRRGYRVDDADSVFALGDSVLTSPMRSDFSIERAELAEWQGVAASAWGHTTPEARAVSDAFAAAAAATSGEQLLIARNDRGQAVGVAALTVRDGVATLGGMSTRVEARRRGVQAALIADRVERAVAAGCDVITSMAEPGGGSARNLRRFGFVEIGRVDTLTREGGAGAVDDS